MFDVNVVKSGYALEFLSVPTTALWRCCTMFSGVCLRWTPQSLIGLRVMKSCIRH